MGKGATLRTTFLAVLSADGTSSEVWAWAETLQGKSKAASQDTLKKTVVSIKDRVPISSLHPLVSGEVLIHLADGHSSLLSKPAEAKAENAAVGFRVVPLAEPESEGSSSSRKMNHTMLVLDPEATSQLSTGANAVDDELLATIVKVTSAARTIGQDGVALNTREKKSRRRKTAMEVIDDAETKTSRSGLLPLGGLSLEIETVKAASENRSTNISSTRKIPLECIADASELLDAHLYHDGQLSLLTRGGEMYLGRLNVEEDGSARLTPWRTLHLRHCSQAQLPSRPAALLRLSASHVLIVLHATGGPSTGKLGALIVDTELDAVIVASDFAMLSASGVADEEQHVTITLMRVGGSQVVVNVNYWGQTSAQEAALSTFWALPFFVPEGSVLRHALGKGVLTSVWLGPEQAAAEASVKSAGKFQKSSTSSGPSDLTQEQVQLLTKMESLQRQEGVNASFTPAQVSEEIDAAFAGWLSGETERLRRSWESERSKLAEVEADAAAAAAAEVDGRSDSDSEIEEDVRIAKQIGSGTQRESIATEKGPAKPHLSYPFVVRLLDAALPPAKAGSSSKTYGRKTVQYLVDRQTLSCGMLANSSQGLISRLRSRQDWRLIMVSLKKVADISESDLVSLLSDVLHEESANGAKATTGDSMERIPSVAAFLSLLITLSVSRPLLRSTLHGRITRVEDVVMMLRILTGWLEERAREPLELQEFLMSEDGVRRKKPRRQRMRLGKKDALVKVPSVSSLTEFAADLVDIYFPLLLSSSPTSRSVLASLSKALGAHLSTCDQLNTLRGPLDAFAKMEADRKQMEALEASLAGQLVFRDPRIARQAAGPSDKSVQAKSETGGGAMRKMDKRSARLQAFESSALIGPYSVETLEI